MLCATFIEAKARMRLPVGLLSALSAPNPHRLPSTVARDDEHLLVAAAKRGDVHAFEELVNRYEAKIFRLTMNITRNREDAEDAMQDAFLKSYAHLKDFQEDSRFYTWLVRISANAARTSFHSTNRLRVMKTSCPASSRIGGPARNSVLPKRKCTKSYPRSSKSWSRISALFSCCATSKSFRQKKPPKRSAFRYPR